MDCKERLRDCFDEMVVYKDLKKTNFFSALSLPSFMRDWLLKKFEDENGNFDKDDMVRFVKKYIPRKDDWTSIKNRVIVEGERVKFLAKISIDIGISPPLLFFLPVPIFRASWCIFFLRCIRYQRNIGQQIQASVPYWNLQPPH